jgi:phosphatidylserine/phosphatidylglycerophosphate/cardiolipin synthase-like enzyme
MGSMNYTQNDIYRNNNNLVMLRSRRAVEAYQAEFDEMYDAKQFGSKRSRDDGASFSQDGTPVRVVFSPDGQAVPILLELINNARSSVRFMAFSFTLEELGAALIARAEAGIEVEGIFEVIGSETESSRQTTLRCAGLDVRVDGNPYRLHHKVFIIDDETVVFGSFNFSASAVNNNDENMVVITDRDLAAQFVAEYQRLRSRATTSRTPCP